MHRRSFDLLAALLLAALALAPPAFAGDAPVSRSGRRGPLILVSIDGFRADYLERGRTPTLVGLAADGVRAEALKPAFPTLTFPNHYTIVTGLYPDHHGIVHNRMSDAARGRRFVYNDHKQSIDPSWWGGEPLWVSVEKQGLHAATMFWPGSDVAIGGVRPSRWRAFDGSVSSADRVTQVLAWLDLPLRQRPAFITLYFDAVDHANHDHGPDSSEVDAALASVDAALSLLVDGLRQRGLDETTNLVVVSDHGIAATAAERTVVLDDAVAIDDVDIATTGVIAGIAPKRGRKTGVEGRLVGRHEHMTCWRRGEIPARLHYGRNPRIPPILCLANVGWVISTAEAIAKPDRHVSLGEHGYDNDEPTMRAIFVAHGPAFVRGVVVPEFDNVDVYPMLVRVLGIRPARNDGGRAGLRVLRSGSGSFRTRQGANN